MANKLILQGRIRETQRLRWEQTCVTGTNLPIRESSMLDEYKPGQNSVILAASFERFASIHSTMEIVEARDFELSVQDLGRQRHAADLSYFRVVVLAAALAMFMYCLISFSPACAC